MKKVGKIFVTIIIGMVILGLTLPLLNVFAQENLQVPLKAVESTVDQLAELKDKTNISDKDKEQQEIQIRREALEKILDLSILEISNLENKINALKLESKDQIAIKEKFLNILLKNREYSEELTSNIKKEGLSLDEVKNLAQQYKDWRENNYNLYIKKITVFILTFQEKDVLKTANIRLDKIISDLNKLESAKLLKKEDTFNNINSSLKNLTNAQMFNSEAEKIIINIIKKELLEVASSTPLIKVIATTTSDVVKQEAASSTLETASSTAPKITTIKLRITDEDKAQELIEKSLQEIKNAYTAFLAISAKVKAKLKIN